MYCNSCEYAIVQDLLFTLQNRVIPGNKIILMTYFSVELCDTRK